MAHRIINNEADFDALGRFLSGLSYPLTVEWTLGRDRSRDQNALMWLWATEAARQYGDRTAADVQHEWKLHHGVPILREDSAEFRAVYDEAIKPLPYHLKIKAMHFIPVTSEMKVRQMVQFLDTVQRECLQNGLRLTDPAPSLSAYQARYRSKKVMAA